MIDGYKTKNSISLDNLKHKIIRAIPIRPATLAILNKTSFNNHSTSKHLHMVVAATSQEVTLQRSQEADARLSILRSPTLKSTSILLARTRSILVKQNQDITTSTINSSSTTNTSHSSNTHRLSTSKSHILSQGNMLLLNCSSSNSLTTTNSSISHAETRTNTVTSKLDVELIKALQTLPSNNRLSNIMAAVKAEAGLSKTETIVSTTLKVVTTIDKRAFFRERTCPFANNSINYQAPFPYKAIFLHQLTLLTI